MNDVKENILLSAEMLFLKYGFKSITMDDVARELGISKKTLYQYFVDKNDLVNQCVDHYLLFINNMCNKLTHVPNKDAVSVMIDIAESVNAMLTQLNTSSLFDLKKYYKPIWDKLESERYTCIHQSVKENLEQGIKKGLYRKDLNKFIVIDIYIYLTGMLTNPETYSQNVNQSNIYIELVKYHLRSICTPKGLELLEEKLKQLKINKQ
jgi:AcrR family transcriptional regulator